MGASNGKRTNYRARIGNLRGLNRRVSNANGRNTRRTPPRNGKSQSIRRKTRGQQMTRPLPQWVCEEHFEMIDDLKTSGEFAEARELEARVRQGLEFCSNCAELKGATK